MAPTLLYYLSFLTATAFVNAGLPSKIYGVNLGSWLLLEPWMLPDEWVRMGGDYCTTSCGPTCIGSEFGFAQKYPQTVDQIFNQHWETWFNQPDVDQLKGAGLNTVRVPLGYWIVEPLVNRTTEFYPRGGILQLQRGLTQLRDAGISVILDHHALPGVATPNQMFAGRCTSDVQFYTPYNYHRALIWTAVMTALSHLDPAFGSVAAIEAINEPIMDANKTLGYGDFQKNFVQVIRAVELTLGIPPVSGEVPPILASQVNVSSALSAAATLQNIFNPEVCKVLKDAAPIFAQVAQQLILNTRFELGGLRSILQQRTALVTNFMDIGWQYNNPSNPADAAIGPQIYDNHLYYSFGGVADANEGAYLTSICNLKRIQTDAALGNSPLFFGEWSLATQFNANASDAFMKQWADAQKLAYGKDAGWIFWNFKLEISTRTADLPRQWSYMEGLRRGYFTQDPSKFNDPHVCDAYINATTTTARATDETLPARRGEHWKRRHHAFGARGITF